MYRRWIKTLLVLCTVLLLVPLFTAPVAKAAGGKNPVVFVHGFFDVKSDFFGKSNFNPLIAYLESRGWPADELYVIQYSNVVGCNINNAYELKAFIENVLVETGSDRVDIVAHSMGGLSSRYYIKYLGGTETVGSLVTLGTPHYGTPMAYLAGVTTGGRQMIPGSSFLNDLNSGDLTPGSIRYTSIYTYADELVPWWRSRVSGWNNIGGWYNMHLTMLFHSRVHRLVANNLTQ